jgi:hypothetical protein
MTDDLTPHSEPETYEIRGLFAADIVRIMLALSSLEEMSGTLSDQLSDPAQRAHYALEAMQCQRVRIAVAHARRKEVRI